MPASAPTGTNGELTGGKDTEGRAVALSNARTVRAGGSDHYPVVATVRWSVRTRR